MVIGGQNQPVLAADGADDVVISAEVATDEETPVNIVQEADKGAHGPTLKVGAAGEAPVEAVGASPEEGVAPEKPKTWANL